MNNLIITPDQFNNITTNWPKIERSCLVDEFYRQQQQKPEHLRSNICMISCPCPKCSILC